MATPEVSVPLQQTRAVARRAVGARLRIGTVVIYLVLIVLALIFFFPFFWTISSSLKSINDLFDFPPLLFPSVPQWGNYRLVLTTVPFLLWVKNTLIVVTLNTCGVVLSASLVAYSFARFQYRGKNALFIVTLATMMLPGQVTLIPQFILFDKLGFVNTLKPLWVPAWFGGSAFFIFLLRQFFRSLPRELDEAARMDGASYVRIYWSVLLPLCKPALATVTVISFISNWDNFLTPLIYLNNQNLFTVALGLSYFQNFPEQAGMPMQNLLMAASLMAVLPLVILFFVAQRYFVQGIVMSGLKG
jgi:ABC-type glycerol-3-phosphate transport system permease component